MRLQRLGTHGPMISVLGFGAWAAGGPWQFGWGPTDDDESVAAIHAAVDAGVNWVDTAAAYGWGHSEEVVGRALGRRDDVYVFTKGGIVPPGNNPANDGDPVHSLDPASIRAECEASLRRLGRDHIDLYQFHWPHYDDSVAVEDSWAVMSELVAEGKVRWPGVCNFDIARLDACAAHAHVQSVQPPYSLVRRTAGLAASGDPTDGTGVLDWAAAHGTGAIVYSPMQTGLLTGSFDAARLDALADDDFRRHNRFFTEPTFSAVLGVVDVMRVIADEHDLSVAELALAWVLAHRGVTGAIVGARRPSQVADWIGAGIVTLSPGIVADLDAAASAAGF